MPFKYGFIATLLMVLSMAYTWSTESYYDWWGYDSSTKYWDRNGSSWGFGTDLSGIWDEDNVKNWNTSSFGWGSTTKWQDWDRALFTGTDSSGSFEVELDGTIKAKSLSFEGSNAFLVGHDNKTKLELDDDGSYINVETGVTVTVDVKMKGEDLVKTGGGTLVLQAEADFDDDAVVEEGTLRLARVSGPSLDQLESITVETGGTVAFDADNQLDSSVDVILAGGTLQTQGTNQSFDTLTLTANSVINLGVIGAGDLHFDDSDGKYWTSGATLTITNWTGDETGGTGSRIFFDDGKAGLTQSQLDQITINGESVQLLETGELVTIRLVPEPSTYIFGAGVVFFITGHVVIKRYKKRYKNSTSASRDEQDSMH